MSETRQKHPACPSCTCVLTELTWSDRCARVNYEDAEQVAEKVINCALDHASYRGDGVPLGMQGGEDGLVRPIVARHLAAVHPEWRHKTVTMDAEQIKAFLREVVAVLRAARNY